MRWQHTGVCGEDGGRAGTAEERACGSVAVALMWTVGSLGWSGSGGLELGRAIGELGGVSMWDAFAFSQVSVGICTAVVFL